MYACACACARGAIVYIDTYKVLCAPFYDGMQYESLLWLSIYYYVLTHSRAVLRAAFGRRTSHFSPMTASSVHQPHEGGAKGGAEGGARGGAATHSSPYWQRQTRNFRPTTCDESEADSGYRFQGARDAHLRFYRGTTSNSEFSLGWAWKGGGEGLL